MILLCRSSITFSAIDYRERVIVEEQSGTLPAAERVWSVDDASALYNVDRWGGDYFEVGADDQVCLFYGWSRRFFHGC